MSRLQYPDAVDSIHFSDQYTGLKPTDSDQAPTELPTGKKVLIFTFNLNTAKVHYLSDILMFRNPYAFDLKL